MKTVFTNASDVIHLFAQQDREQTMARCSNVFFEYDKLYSYGHHYLLAEYINNNGNTAIIINDTGYSSTTAKHISIVRSATRQYTQFFVMSADKDKVIMQLKNLANKLIKARKPEIYIHKAETLYQDYAFFCAWRGIKKDSKIIGLYNVFTQSDKKDAYVKFVKKIAAKEKREREKSEAKAKQLFFDYKINRIYGYNDFDLIRMSQYKQTIETSQGVSVPITEAKILFDRISKGKDIKGQKIDNWTVIGIENGILKIGCHRLKMTDVKKIGEQIINY